jgi:hypothetical protein
LALTPRFHLRYLRRVNQESLPQKAQKAVRPSLSDIPDEPPHWLLDLLDWLIRLIARFIVLGLGFAVLSVGWVLYSGADETRYPGLSAIPRLAEHWPALALLVVPLFYLPVRRLIYRAKAFGDHPAVPAEQPVVTGNAALPGKGTQIEEEHTP